MRGGLRQNNPYRIQTIAAAGQCQRRLLPEFAWQGLHDRRTDVGRITDNKIVTAFFQRTKIVGFDQRNPPREPVASHVDSGHVEGVF